MSGGKLIYFDLGGRAEAIRALLFHAERKYVDHRVQYEEFLAIQ